LFFPEKAAQLNFATLTFVDKELIVPILSLERRISDVLATVETLTGEVEIILLHLEIEASDKATLPVRMFEYYALLRILFKLPVLPIAVVLLPKVGGLTTQVYRERLFGEDVLTLTYGQVGLRDLDGEQYFDPTNPLAVTLTALMKINALRKAEMKLASLRAILDSILTEERKLFLIKMVDTYLPTKELVIVGAETMAALQAIEQHWSDLVRQEGRQEGRAEMLLRILRLKFGQLPMDVVSRVNRINDEATFYELLAQVLNAQALAEVSMLKD
jgi:hypothetical protein